MKKSILIAGLASAGLLTSAIASADHFDDRWYGTAQIGGTFADADDFDIGGATYLGFGKGLTENFRLELSGFYSNLDLDGEDEGDEYEKWGLGVSGLYSFNPGADYEIFAIAGLHGVNVNIGSFDYNSPQVEIGVGGLMPITSHGTALRAEYRYRMDYHGSDIDNSYTFYDHTITVGLHVPFGSLSKAPKRQAPKRGDKVVLPATSFALDSARLTASAKTTLNRVVATLKDNPEIELEIGGHADDTGAKQYNLELSRKRAESVRDYMVSKGISKSRLSTRSYGETRPVADNTTAAGRMRNRRVELTVQ